MTFFCKPNELTNKFANGLSVEQLEERMMLSSVEIIAAGTGGFELFDLQINGEAVQRFTANSGADSRDFQSFFFETSETVTADDISIEFLNDFFDPDTGFDSNLVVERNCDRW